MLQSKDIDSETLILSYSFYLIRILLFYKNLSYTAKKKIFAKSTFNNMSKIIIH